MASTYTVHGHIKRRDGRQEAFWTRTGLTKSAAQKLAKEQRAETGGIAKIVPEEGPAYAASKATAHHATRKKSPAQLDREIAAALVGDLALKIGDAVQLRWEPGTGGVIRRFASEGDQSMALVATSRGERKVPTDALVRVRKEHESRVRRASETRHHSTRAAGKRLLTGEQIEALRAFAKANGRSWKSKLNDAWSTGRYDDYPGTAEYGLLQQVRNAFGPSWLVKLRLDDAKTHSARH